jgi:hypothetical protein
MHPIFVLKNGCDRFVSESCLSLCLCISSYSIHPNKVPWVGGRDHVSMVLICYLPANTLYFGSCGRSWT